jgi:hypothetical protein
MRIRKRKIINFKNRKGWIIMTSFIHIFLIIIVLKIYSYVYMNCGNIVQQIILDVVTVFILAYLFKKGNK